MHDEPELGLHEEVLLLALRDVTGQIASGTWYSYALGAAIVAELLVQQRITIDNTKKRALVDLVDGSETGDAILDDAIEKIENAKRRAKVTTWVDRFGSTRDLHHDVALQLCDKKILRADEDRVLLFFSRKVYPEIDPAPERRIIDRLRDAIFSESTDVHPRTALLIAVARHANLLEVIFDRKKLKERGKRMDQVVNGDAVGAATKEAVEAAQMVALVVTIMPVIMAPVIIHH